MFRTSIHHLNSKLKYKILIRNLNLKFEIQVQSLSSKLKFKI